MAGKKRIESGNFNKKPTWFNALNTVWESSYVLGTEVKLDKDTLIKSARKESGLKDLGSAFWDEPLDKLL